MFIQEVAQEVGDAGEPLFSLNEPLMHQQKIMTKANQCLIEFVLMLDRQRR